MPKLMDSIVIWKDCWCEIESIYHNLFICCSKNSSKAKERMNLSHFWCKWIEDCQKGSKWALNCHFTSPSFESTFQAFLPIPPSRLNLSPLLSPLSESTFQVLFWVQLSSPASSLLSDPLLNLLFESTFYFFLISPPLSLLLSSRLKSTLESTFKAFLDGPL